MVEAGEGGEEGAAFIEGFFGGEAREEFVDDFLFVHAHESPGGGFAGVDVVGVDLGEGGLVGGDAGEGAVGGMADDGVF